MLKVHAADQHRELFPEENSLLDREVIAERVQGTAERQVRFSVIRPVQLLHQVFEPTVGPLNSGVEDFQAREFHAIGAARRLPEAAY